MSVQRQAGVDLVVKKCEQSLVDPTHENRVGTSFCESKGRVGEVSTGCMGSGSWSMLVIVRTSRLGRRDG